MGKTLNASGFSVIPLFLILIVFLRGRSLYYVIVDGGGWVSADGEYREYKRRNLVWFGLFSI